MGEYNVRIDENYQPYFSFAQRPSYGSEIVEYGNTYIKIASGNHHNYIFISLEQFQIMEPDYPQFDSSIGKGIVGFKYEPRPLTPNSPPWSYVIGDENKKNYVLPDREIISGELLISYMEKFDEYSAILNEIAAQAEVDRQADIAVQADIDRQAAIDADAQAAIVAAEKFVTDWDTGTVEGNHEKKIAEIKVAVRWKLLETDWYIVRKAEDEGDIPQDIHNYRKSIRNLTREVEVIIRSLSDTKAIVNVSIIFPPMP